MKKLKLKNVLTTLLAVALTATLAIGGTLAYLTTDAGNEKNVFSVGNIDVSLKEEVDIYGEGGEVEENEDGAEYIEIMPGDYLKKEVTVTNNGKTPAYVAVTVTLNNADKINAAIDEVYEKENYTAEQIQEIYADIFDGWGINYDPRPGAAGVNDARGVIDSKYGLPEHVLHVDFAKTTQGSTLIGANNWFIAGSETAGQYWVDGPQEKYDGYYTQYMGDYEICYTYYLLLPAGKSSTLFNGLNVPAEFNADQLAMFDGLEINVKAKAIQADNMAVADKYQGDANGKAKTAFAILADDIEAPEYSSKPIGKMGNVYTAADRIWGEHSSNAKVSHVIKIYSGDTYMGETSLNNINGIIDGDVTVTWNIKLDATSSTDSYWSATWENAPSIAMQPDRAELWVDGVKVDESKIQMNGPDNLNQIGGFVINNKGKILRYVVKGTDSKVPGGEEYVPFVSGNTELATAIKNGTTSIVLKSGEYYMPADAKGKTLTICGSKDTIIEIVPEGQGEANGQLDYNLNSSTVTFNGVTIKTNNQTYAGYAGLTGTYNNCTFDGHYSLQRDSVFNNCTFNVSGNQYNIWTWGAPNATFDGCTFNSDGKALLLYGTVNTNLTVKNCTFNDNGGLTALKAAIEIGDDYGKSYNLIVNNTIVNGYEINDEGTSTGTTLWANKNSMGTDKLNVVVDGVGVY